LLSYASRTLRAISSRQLVIYVLAAALAYYLFPRQTLPVLV
jgi:hypothetical protein